MSFMVVCMSVFFFKVMNSAYCWWFIQIWTLVYMQWLQWFWDILVIIVLIFLGAGLTFQIYIFFICISIISIYFFVRWDAVMDSHIKLSHLRFIVTCTSILRSRYNENPFVCSNITGTQTKKTPKTLIIHTFHKKLKEKDSEKTRHI